MASRASCAAACCAAVRLALRLASTPEQPVIQTPPHGLQRLQPPSGHADSSRPSPDVSHVDASHAQPSTPLLLLAAVPVQAAVSPTGVRSGVTAHCSTTTATNGRGSRGRQTIGVSRVHETNAMPMLGLSKWLPRRGGGSLAGRPCREANGSTCEWRQQARHAHTDTDSPHRAV